MNKKEKTKQKIIDSFWVLYQNTSFQKMTVKRICQETNINRSTFYEYFMDIYEILDTIENSIFPSSELLPRFVKEEKSTILDLELHFLLLKEKRSYLKILFSEHGNITFRKKFIDYIRPMILDIFQGDVLTDTTQYTIEYILWGILGAFEYHIIHDEEEKEEDFLKSVITLIERTTF